MPEPVKLFVLLHHTLPDGSEHWDLCLDQGPTMATWQLLRNPLATVSAYRAAPISARRIADHRRLYLDYEGPVSGDRGHVVRLDRGPYSLLDRQPNRWTVHLAGSILIGTYELLATDDSDAWMLIGRSNAVFG